MPIFYRFRYKKLSVENLRFFSLFTHPSLDLSPRSGCSPGTRDESWSKKLESLSYPTVTTA